MAAMIAAAAARPQATWVYLWDRPPILTKAAGGNR